MRRVGLIMGLLALAFPATASAATFTVTVEGTPPADLAQIEAAISQQVQDDVAPLWHVTPVTWGPGGIPVTLVPLAALQAQCGPNTGGCHSGGLPDAIFVADDYPAWAVGVLLDHEVLETEVNPAGGQPEICDPVENVYYTSPSDPYVSLSDFILPGGGDWVGTQEDWSARLRRTAAPLAVRRSGERDRLHVQATIRYRHRSR